MITSTYPDPEVLFCWARYLYWADLHFRRYLQISEESVLEKSGEVPTDWPVWWRVFAATSQWYAAEYVVIEGWRDLGGSDSEVNAILVGRQDFVHMLRRYRNGVFHFSPRFFEPRFLDFLRASMRTIPWLHHLHEELLRYYWQFVENLPGSTSEQRAELRHAALTAVGWVPSDIFAARLRAAELLGRQADEISAGDNSPEAQELRTLAEHAIELARKGLREYGRNIASFYASDGESP